MLIHHFHLTVLERIALLGLYCSDSWSPGWGHIYITIIVSLSVTVAMYCLFQLYMPISVHLAPHKPLLKLFSVKAVVFLTFWQASGLSLLSMFGVIKDTPYMTADDINTGIAAILETFEMTCFAVLHFRAFSYKPYRTNGQKFLDPTPRLPSLMHALDIRDMWREIQDGSVYMGKTIRGVEAEEEARRRTHFAKVMGREREFIEAKESWPIEDSLCDEDLLLDSRGRERQLPCLEARGDKLGMTLDDDDRRKSRKRDSAGGKQIAFGMLGLISTSSYVQSMRHCLETKVIVIHGRISHGGEAFTTVCHKTVPIGDWKSDFPRYLGDPRRNIADVANTHRGYPHSTLLRLRRLSCSSTLVWGTVPLGCDCPRITDKRILPQIPRDHWTAAQATFPGHAPVMATGMMKQLTCS